jgi:hypothetical protein
MCALHKLNPNVKLFLPSIIIYYISSTVSESHFRFARKAQEYRELLGVGSSSLLYKLLREE